MQSPVANAEAPLTAGSSMALEPRQALICHRAAAILAGSGLQSQASSSRSLMVSKATRILFLHVILDCFVVFAHF